MHLRYFFKTATFGCAVKIFFSFEPIKKVNAHVEGKISQSTSAKTLIFLLKVSRTTDLGGIFYCKSAVVFQLPLNVYTSAK